MSVKLTSAFLIYSAILFLFTSTTTAQTVQDSLLFAQLKYADNLLAGENYFDAATEYERLIYFDTLKLYTYPALIHKAEAFRSGGRYSDARTSLIAALSYARDDSAKFFIKTQIVRVQLLDRNFGSVLTILDELQKDPACRNRRQEIYYWNGWLEMMQDDWSRAAESFGRCDSALFLKNFCSGVDKSKYPVSFIKLISGILPGSGQVLTGHPVNGLISFGWNALFGYLTVSAFADSRVLDGFLNADLLWMRFYTGNLENAEKFAVEKNTGIANDALRYLENNYQGSKP